MTATAEEWAFASALDKDIEGHTKRLHDFRPNELSAFIDACYLAADTAAEVQAVKAEVAIIVTDDTEANKT